MRKLSFILFILLLFAGCSNHNNERIPPNIAKLKNLTVIPSNTQPTYQINLKKDLVYGESKDVLIGSLDGIAVDDSGKVYLLDGIKREIDVFKPDGHYITYLGREGKGPGEFVNPPYISIISNKLYAYDIIVRRVSIFSTDSLALIRTINLKQAEKSTQKALIGYGLHKIYPRNNGLFLGYFMRYNYPRQPGFDPDKYKVKYYLINDRGELASNEILELKGLATSFLFGHVGGRTIGMLSTFLPRTLLTTSNDGHILTGWSKNFLIKEYSPQGTYMRAIYHPFDKAPLIRDTLINRYKSDKFIQDIIRQNALPKTLTALKEIKLDGKNHLWVSTIVPNMKIYQWWVLNMKGKLLARFDWPRSKPIKVVKNGYLYTQETDTATGISKIVRYKITMHS